MLDKKCITKSDCGSGCCQTDFCNAGAAEARVRSLMILIFHCVCLHSLIIHTDTWPDISIFCGLVALEKETGGQTTDSYFDR